MIVSTIYLVAILLLALLFFKITHIIWKTIIFTILIIILVFGITGYAIYEDIQKTINEDKIFIISGDDMVLTGIIFSDNIEERVYLNQWEIEEYSNFFKNKNLQSILDEKYLLINLDISSMNNKTILNYSNNLVEGEKMKNIMLSESPGQLMMQMRDIEGNENNYDEIITFDEMIRYKMDLSGPLIKEIIISDKNIYDKIEIYPRRITIKVMDELPIIFNLIKNKINDNWQTN
jgi:hypothetical protein